jgi:NitT/TauT family transport system substrate-binding protein
LKSVPVKYATELRARQLGHVLINSTVDRPWSQYYCCMMCSHKAFVQQYPIATKRVLRAILKAADLCTSEPDRAARFLVEKGYTTNYAYARETVQDVVYRQWREYAPEDTVRFYALRLQEAGMIRNTPQKIITQGTGSCPCSVRLIQQPDKPGKMPLFQPVYEGVLPWSRICSSTSSR